ncbi:HD domain-containing protein [Streptomyces sp. SID3343]|uniref:HD domain-containing protein n=1 Tax=Streptomyces sp. SID3343 TaxID=2690260 RepID=UPI00136ED521|nr:HD domain-containing protein [Streptomyces sp. SID3343]MYW05281.1 HD domain-containing protein [Streptomyces sp. SID3343]
MPQGRPDGSAAIAGFTLDDAVALARAAHDGQLDKGGHPYITHPLRVMDNVDGIPARMAAVLHDVIEDTPVGADQLRAAGVPARIVDAVIALSKLPGEPLEASMARAAADPIALVVKRADIADNRSEARLGQLDEATQVRLRHKYTRSIELLEEFAAH